MPAVIFDFDGLIIDTERVLAEALIEALTEWDVAATVADFGHLYGSTEMDHEWEPLLRGWGVPLTHAELEAEIWSTFKAKTLSLPLLPGVADVLDAAREAEWRIGLATGHGQPSLGDHLERLAIQHYFHEIVTSREVEKGKPAPDIFLASADRLRVAPGECIVLEDSPHGCTAGLAAGMTVIACPSVVTAHCEFPPGVRVVGSLAGLSLPSFA